MKVETMSKYADGIDRMDESYKSYIRSPLTSGLKSMPTM